MKYIIANLKSSMSLQNRDEYLDYISKNLLRDDKIIIAPSFLDLKAFLDTGFVISSQNAFHEEGDSYTGVVTIKQLKNLGVSYTVIGYGDVRTNFKETEEMLFKKIKLALKNNIKIIYCVGETREQRVMKKSHTVVKQQLKDLLTLDSEYLSDIIIAYEPLWAIGSGATPTISEINDMTVYIKQLFDNKIEVVYGGSVNKNNVKTIIDIESLDGVIVGKSSYSPVHLVDLVDAIYDKK